MGDHLDFENRKKGIFHNIFLRRKHTRRSRSKYLGLLALIPVAAGIRWLVRQPADAAVRSPEREAAGRTTPDDLKEIEGIGPKSEAVLRKAGVASFSRLAKMDVRELKEVLREAGMPSLDPSTWPEQAEKAARGDWEGLYKLRDELKGGRRV